MVALYLDHNATTPVSSEHMSELARRLTGDGVLVGNPSSPHAAGRNAHVALTEARRTIAAGLGADVAEIIFVSGGSEANNMATSGILLNLAQTTQVPLSQMSAVFSSVEHPSVREPLEHLARTANLALTEVPVGSCGRLKAADLVRALRADTTLVTCMAANNETGAVQPIEEFAAWLHARRWVQRKPRDEPLPLDSFLAADVSDEVLRTLHFHVDAVQAWGKIPCAQWALPGVDSVALSGHKLGALAGTGVLWLRRGRRFQPLILGGAQERNRRAGTENTAGIVSLGIVACAMAQEDWWQKVDAVRNRCSHLQKALARFASVRINTPDERAHALPNTLNFSVSGKRLRGEDVLMELDMNSIYASSGSACSSGANLPSKVLLAMGRTPEEAKNAIRISFGLNSTDAQVAHLSEVLVRLFETH